MENLYIGYAELFEVLLILDYKNKFVHLLKEKQTNNERKQHHLLQHA